MNEAMKEVNMEVVGNNERLLPEKEQVKLIKDIDIQKEYIGKERESSIVKLNSGNSTKRNGSSSSDEGEGGHRLKFLSSGKSFGEGGINFFVGGSVWAIDWAPSSPSSKNEIQYLAIGAHKEVLSLHKLHKRYEGKNLIQIWGVKCIEKNSNDKFCSGNHHPIARFSLGIIHKSNAVWALKWCPRSFVKNPCSNSYYKRLGLLACGFADGSIKVYSVPDPESFAVKNPSQSTEANAAGVFLDLTAVLEKTFSGTGHATSFDWYIGKEGKIFLLCGDSQGYIGMWHLKEEDEPLCLFLGKIIDAPIAGVAFSPSDFHSFFIATRGKDIALCDIRQAFTPLRTHNTVYGRIWSIIWKKNNKRGYKNDVFISTDEGKLVTINSKDGKCSIMCKTGYANVIWDISYSPQNDNFLTCGADGNIILHPGTPKSKKERKRAKALEVVLVETKMDENQKILQFCNVEKSLCPVKIEGKAFEPMVSINCVSWNPSPKYCRWFAGAGNAGLAMRDSHR